MKPWKASARLCGCLLGVAALTGCYVEAGTSAPAPAPAPARDVRGSLTVRWTIAGSTSPTQCAYYRDDTLKVVVYDRTGAALSETYAPCEHFSTTIDLFPGHYEADATLVDVNRTPRSLTLPLHNIVVTTGTDLAIDVDFPTRSMLE